LMRDPNFSKVFADSSHPDSAKARERMAKLDAVISGEAGGSSESGQAPTPAPADYDVSALGFGPEENVSVVAEAHALAKETAAAIGLDREVVKGGLAVLDRAVSARGNRPMDANELAQFDTMIEQRWGDQHAANLKLVDAAFARAGEK